MANLFKTIPCSFTRYSCVTFMFLKFLFAFLVMSPFLSLAQLSVEESELMARMTPKNTIPTELISTRSVVVYQNTFTPKELQEAHTFILISRVCWLAMKVERPMPPTYWLGE